MSDDAAPLVPGARRRRRAWFAHSMVEWRVFQALSPHLARHRWRVAGVVLLGAVSSLAEGVGISLFIPLLRTASDTEVAPTRHWLTDSISGFFTSFEPAARLPLICGLIIAAIVTTSALAFSYRLLIEWIHARIAHELRSGIFNRLLSVDYRTIERGRSGQMLNTLAGESWRAAGAAGQLIELAIIIVTLAMYAGLLLLISWQLTLVTIVAMGLISLLVNRVTRQSARLGRITTRVNGALGNRMVELLSGMPIIRAMVREDHERRRFDHYSRRVERAHFNLNALGASVEPLYETLAATVVVVICYVSLQNSQNLAALLVFIFVLYRMQPRMKLFDAMRTRLRSLQGAVADVNRGLEQLPAEPEDSGTVPFAGLGSGIRLANVSFSYNRNDPSALSNVSFDLPAGRTTALVGPSGSGKSTIVKLLLRFYDPTAGSILIDGRPLAGIELRSWRERVAWVSQDLFVFNASVRENIAYGRLDATDKEIVEAAKLAAADEFIRALPRGYDTLVGDSGLRLSGGQRQRITLARALIRNPEVLILDEATNALDAISENLIQEALNRVRRDRTVIVIAHRLSTVRQADQIIMLSQGRLSETGSPDELLAIDGPFASMFKAQNATFSQ